MMDATAVTQEAMAETNMEFPAKLKAFGVPQVQSTAGQFFFLVGVLGLVISATSHGASSSLAAFRFPLEWAGVWTGLWLLLHRVPPFSWAVLWLAIGSAAWLALH